MSLKNFHIDNTWTLFLDRDGVINKRIIDDYVLKPEQFEFNAGVLDATKVFAEKFGRIVVVTNQQGIGKGMMTKSDLDEIHALMVKSIMEKGGRIDKVYHCPDLKGSNSLYRKPNIGMALSARKYFPEIAFKRAIMAGDSLSDMEFGKRVGMKTVLIKETPEMARKYPQFVDYYYPSLIAFADVIR